MPHRAVRVQSWLSVVGGLIFFIAWIIEGGATADGFARLTACVAFIAVGALGLTTARAVRELEERLARLESRNSTNS